MLIWHEYFNIIWQERQRYDSCQKMPQPWDYHILQQFLLLQVYELRLSQAEQKLKHTDQEGDAHSGCGTLKVNK